jgi:3-methyl-2-oxobutanoate hydroxymethyltransferase
VKKRKTILDIGQMKAQNEKITVLTAYDYPFAKLMDQAGIDIILVGDSVGSVVSGYDNTLPVTLEEMLYHTRAVVRGSAQALIVTDMPFMSYQTDLRDARINAGRLIKEGGAQAVKLEGGEHLAETIAAIVAIDIPVVGHIGLTPQSIHRMGGFKVQGRQEAQARQILADAKAVEEAGAFALVLEGIPRGLARQVTEAVGIPTIGIGAGPDTSGQVLVLQDLLGMSPDFKPRFVRRYLDGFGLLKGALDHFASDVREGAFPAAQETYGCSRSSTA